MKEKLLRVALPILCLGLVQCTSSTTDTSSAPTAFAATRLLASNGMGDNTFGPNKTFVTTDIDPTLIDFAMAVAIQADNKIVVAGSNGLAGAGQIALVRYNEDGSLDSGFGTAGIVKKSLALPAFASAIAIQPADSKIVVAALAFQATTNGAGNTSIVLLRYMPNGTLDTTFNTSGVAASAAIGSGFPGDGCALLLQASGNIVVAGSAQDGNLVLYRYTSAGVLDASFGAPTPNGKTVTPLAPSASSPLDRSPAMAAQSDGRIIVAARNGDDQAVLRYSVDGVLDTSFGGTTDGIVKTDIGGTINYANAVAIQSPGMGAPSNLDKIVVVGHSGLSDNTSDISVVRYTKDGALDTTTFGSGGIVTTDINGQFDNAFSVVLQDGGGGLEPKILVSGNTGLNGTSNTVVLRYTPTGTADSTFGSTLPGQIVFPLAGPSSIASGNAIAIQPGRGIVVAGYD